MEKFKRTFNIQEEQKFFISGKFLIFFKCNWLIILSDMEKHIKNPTYPHINMSFKDFCDGTMDSSKIQCILDCPSNNGEKPSVIKYVFFFIIKIQITKSCLVDLLMKVTPHGINNQTILTV